MKKSHSYDQLSNIKCATPGCATKLKLRLVEERPTVKFCYKCWQKKRNKGGSK